MKYDVLTSGYVSMDHIIKIASPLQVGYTSLVTNADNTKIHYGGCGVNIAVALSRLGKKGMPILRVGEVWETNGFKKFLEDAGVPLEGTKVLKDGTTSTCKPDNRYFADQCKKHNVPIVFGMKDDFDAFPVEFLKELLTESTIIFTNEVERAIIEKLFGCDTIEELFKLGKVQILITTLGKDGSICYERTADGIKEHRIGVCKIDKIVDATGTGDAYMSGFLYGYLNGRPTEECLRLGTALSAFVIQAVGCCTNIPMPEALEQKAAELL